MQPMEKNQKTTQIWFDKVLFLSYTDGFCDLQHADDMIQAVTTQ